MPNGAILAAALTDHSAHPYSLEVGSLDVLKEPNAPGWGVPIESIDVTEAGPGAISSMTFVIDDPEQSITISGPLAVTFRANDGANPETIYFRGWVDGFDVVPDFGGQGRSILVRCSGVEQLLDWYIVPPTYSTTFGTILTKYVGIMAMNFGPLLTRTGVDAGTSMIIAPWTRSGSFAFPMGNLVRPTEPSLTQPATFTTYTAPGGTLRNAILDIASRCSFYDSVTALTDFQAVKILLTVDWFYGLRLWEDDPALQPDDYTTLTVLDTYAGTNVAAGLRYSQDFAGINRGAYVVSGATDYGVIGDGTGFPGRLTLLSDSTLTTVGMARSRGLSVIGEDAAFYRGEFTLGPFNPATTVHAGSLINITDSSTGLAAVHRITEIQKTFLGNGQQTWKVTFGGLPEPRVSRLVRRYTRAAF